MIYNYKANSSYTDNNVINNEKILLTSLLRDTSIFAKIFKHIKSWNYFYNPYHQDIYKSIILLQDNNYALNIETIKNKLSSLITEDYDLVAQYIDEIVALSIITVEPEALAEKLSEGYKLRQLANKTFLNKELSDPFLDYFNNECKTASILTETKKRLNKRNGSNYCDILTGFYSLDYVIGGLRPSNVYVIEAKPSVGKTAFMVSLVSNILSIYHSKNVIVFSPGNSKQELTHRLLSCLSEIALEKIAKGILEDNELKKLNQNAIDFLAEKKLFIDDEPMLDINELREKLFLLKAEKTLDIVFIDYLQLMTCDSGRNKNDEIVNIMKGLKSIAKEFDIPLIVLSQLNNTFQKSFANERLPQKPEINFLTTVEQKADVILFMYRPDFYDKTYDKNEKPVRGETNMRVVKNNMGQLDTIRLKGLFDVQKFIEFGYDFECCEEDEGEEPF